MSNDLVKNESNSVDVLTELQNTEKVVQALMQSKHYSKMGSEGVYAIVHKSKSLGVNIIDALNGGLYYVQGKVGMSTELMACLIRAQGHSISRDPKSTPSNCILIGKRKDTGDVWQSSFSIDDAKRAGIFKSTWEKYPDVMCYNRAMSKLARQLFPDIIKGAGYTKDELDEIAKGKPKEDNFSSEVEIVASIDTVPSKELETISFEELTILESLIDRDANKKELTDLVMRSGITDISQFPKNRYQSLLTYIHSRQSDQKNKTVVELPTQDPTRIFTDKQIEEMSEVEVENVFA